jgi:uncharacterized membrane protein
MADERPMPSAEDADKGKVMAFLGYLCCFLIPLLAAKDNRFCLYHVEQQIVLFGFWIVAYVIALIFGVLAMTTHIVPLAFVGYVGYLVGLVLWVMGVINSLTGKAAPLPLIGQFGAKLNLMK